MNVGGNCHRAINMVKKTNAGQNNSSINIVFFFLEGKNGEKTRTENKDKFNRLDFRSCCSCINQFTGCRRLNRILCRNKRRNCLKKAIFVCYT